MKRVVIKFGTKTLISGDGKLNKEVFAKVAKQVAKIKESGVGVAIVSSGGIQAGKEAIESLGRGSFFLDGLNKKEIAGIGCRHLLNRWGEAFGEHGLEVCEMLVTHANWSNVNERENIKKGVLDCFGLPFIPVINENDVVSDEEIRWMEEGISENDKLARMVAVLIEADAVLFLTEVGGVYDKNPINGCGAKILKEVNGVERLSLSGCSDMGAGGMEAKMKEAMMCLKGGVGRVAIAGVGDKIITDFVSGKKVGTEVCI